MASALKVGGNGHSVGMTNMLTCRPFKEVQATEFGDVGWGGGISIDQELAKRVKGPPLQSVELGVQTQTPSALPAALWSPWKRCTSLRSAVRCAWAI